MRAPRTGVRLASSLLLFTMFSVVPLALTRAAAAPAAPVPCDQTKGPCWTPGTGSLPWQFQLQGTLNPAGGCLYASTDYINTAITATAWNGATNIAPKVFDIDIYQDAACNGGVNNVLVTRAVADIHARGAKAIAYMSAGTAENFRPDYSQYVSFNNSCNGCLLGNTVGGFKDERWLNLSDDGSVTGINPNTGATETPAQFIRDELTARIAQAKLGGFDAVEFDNVDSYENRNGFRTTYAQQLAFNESIANLAHANGYTVALKNDVGQANDLQPYFDFAISEQCFQYRECNYPPPGLQVWPSTYGKAVFNVEYKGKLSNICPLANSSSYNFNSAFKDVNLYDLPWTPCRG